MSDQLGIEYKRKIVRLIEEKTDTSFRKEPEGESGYFVSEGGQARIEVIKKGDLTREIHLLDHVDGREVRTALGLTEEGLVEDLLWRFELDGIAEETDLEQHVVEQRDLEQRKKAFMSDLMDLYDEHGLALGHEDGYGGFLLRDDAEDLRKWVKNAVPKMEPDVRGTDND